MSKQKVILALSERTRDDYALYPEDKLRVVSPNRNQFHHVDPVLLLPYNELIMREFLLFENLEPLILASKLEGYDLSREITSATLQGKGYFLECWRVAWEVWDSGRRAHE